MSVDFGPSETTGTCDRCASDQAPVVELYLVGDMESRTFLCVLCLAEAIDAVTGWHHARQIDTALMFYNPPERLRNPEKRGHKRGDKAPPQELEWEQ